MHVKSGDKFRDNKTGRKGRVFAVETVIGDIYGGHVTYTDNNQRQRSIKLSRLTDKNWYRVEETSELKSTGSSVSNEQAEQLGTVDASVGEGAADENCGDV